MMGRVYPYEKKSEEHVFSEAYRKKKQEILGAYEELPKPKRTPMVKAAIAVLAVILISGTTMAYGSDILERFYNMQDVEVDSKYLYSELAQSNYDGEITVKTDNQTDDVDFQVLMAKKGTHTVTVAMLITLNSFQVPDVPGYRLSDYIVSDVDEKALGIDDKVVFWRGGWESASHNNELELKENQILFYNEYEFDEGVDLTGLNGMEIYFERFSYLLMPEDISSDSSDMIFERAMPTEEGEGWTVEIPISDENYTDLCYSVNSVHDLLGQRIYIKQITVSPKALSFQFDHDKTVEAEDGNNLWSYGGDTPASLFNLGGKGHLNVEKVYLIMTDGNEIRWRNVGGGSSSGFIDSPENHIVQEDLFFDVPIDASQVAGLRFGNETIMFSDLK